MKLRAATFLLLALGAAQCGGTTGGHLIEMPFEAGGIARDTTQPFSFTTNEGWSVTLTQAKVALGPLYFNIDAAPSDPSIFRTGVVILQVTNQFVVDTLDPTLRPAGGADGETGTAVSVEIGFYTTANMYNYMGLDGGLPAPLAGDGQQGTAYLAGQASKGGAVIQFAGRVQITDALVTSQSPIDQLARVPGACPTGIENGCPLTLTTTSGPLELRVNPSHWFDFANFCEVVTPPPTPGGTDGGVVATPPDGSAADAGARDAGASDGGTTTTGIPAPCSPVAGTVYSWVDTNPFNSAVLGNMKGATGVYQFSLGHP